jgi:Putative auto-transporter adhesin, head GIN domain
MSSRILNLCFLVFIGFTGTLMAQKTETRALSSFSRIGVAGAYEVTLVQSDKEEIFISAKGIELERIKTEVKNNTLEIETKKGRYADSDVKITIYYKEIKELMSSGSSDIEAKNPIKAEKFEYASSGSGNFKAEFETKKLEVALSGSGNIEISGKADAQSYALSGSSEVDASKLSGTSAEVAISGSGDVELNISGRVKSSVSGSGRVSNNN